MNNDPANDFRRSLFAYSLVSFPRKYLYVRTPKVASNRILKSLIMLEGFDPGGGIEKRFFLGLRQITALSEREVSWVLDSGDFFRFCFIRNPYSRLYSGYQSKIACAYDGPIHESLHKRTLRWKSGISNRTGVGVDAIDFPAFVDFVTDQPDEGRDRHWRLQTATTRPDRIPYDIIGRHETFARDFDCVLRRLGAGDAVLTDAKGFRNNTVTRDWRDSYDADIADKVYQAYEADFSILGYDRTSWQK